MIINNEKYNFQKTINVVCLLVIFAGIFITGYGLYRLKWPDSIPWQLIGFYRFTIFFACTAFFLIFLCRKLRKNVYLIAALIIFLLSLIFGHAWHLIVVIWFFVSSSLIGFWFLKKFQIIDQSWITNFLVGTVCYGFIIGITVHFPINFPSTYALILLIPIIFGWNLFVIWSRRVIEFNQFERNCGCEATTILIATFAVIYVAVAFMPELGYDALVSHLFIPGQILHRHQWTFDINTYIWAVTPLFADWIYSILYLLGGESAARLLNVVFILLIAALIQSMAIWAKASIVGARFGALIFLSSPLVFAEGNSLFVEAIWTAYIVAGLFIIFKAFFNSEPTNKEQGQFFIVSAILIGAALATKVLTLFVIPIVFLMVISNHKSWIYSCAERRRLYLGIFFFVLISSGAYLYAWYATGNPLFPFYNKFFNSPYYPPENFIDSRWNKGLTWDFIYRLTFNSGDYLESLPGVSGFQWLLLLPTAIICLLFYKEKKGILIAIVAILTIAICFHFTAYLRYIFPSFALLCGVCGIGFSHIFNQGRLQAIVIYVMAVICILLNALFFPSGLFVYQDFPLQSTISEVKRDDYLLKRLPMRIVVKFLNNLNINKTPVAIFGEPQAAGINSDVLYIHWHNVSWSAKVEKVNSINSAANLLILNNVTYVVIDTSINRESEPLKYIKEVTHLLAKFGTIEVRKLDESYRFNNEIVLNPNLSSSNNWKFNGEATYDPVLKTAIVNVSSPVNQIVEITPGLHYQNRIIAKCLKYSCLGRIQVNWLNESYKTFSTNIEVFEATQEWVEYKMVVIAPAGAKFAEIYGVSHNHEFIQLKKISMSY